MDSSLKSRVGQALFWVVLYAVIWAMGWFRPSDLWVNFVIVGAILVSHLPPSPIRYFLGAITWVIVGAVLYFVVNLTHPIFLILIAVSIAQNVIAGVNDLKPVRPE